MQILFHNKWRYLTLMFLAIWIINYKVHFSCCSEALGSFEPDAQKKDDQNMNTIGVVQEATISTRATDCRFSHKSCFCIFEPLR